ncbi:glycosyltransferase [uncultured Sunxiuqinia sp.]|uniref:glycosyltransferase n=1 Tax=uncultured Sunxiuqinia sp. TaxID=1573825 RepID=UPI002619F154|nr:glycosyltransferase [uncultured Sunxiuqinia sp.]
MTFANRYIQRNINYPAWVSEMPAADLGMIVVIPCFDEPDILRTIRSLAACQPPRQQVEVIVVVNQSEHSPETVTLQNQQSIQELEAWQQSEKPAFFQLHVLVPPPFRKKHAGAGLARKTGMDEAIRRFAAIHNADGLLISLDADTLVAPNYLVALEEHFQKAPRDVAATLKFEHRISELEEERHRQGMQLYETYLHYYKQAMAFTGFPHAIYTIGSAFAVRAEAYVKQGGMNRKQAGEDFYFLHKLAQAGHIGEINQTCVYPSARISHRVPFGTGPVLRKWLEGDESLTQTYNFQAFQDLKQLFDLLPALYAGNNTLALLNQLPAPLKAFLTEDGFLASLEEVRANAARYSSFQKRFFANFNAFKMLKFLNFTHPHCYPLQDLDEAYRQLKQT